MLEEIAPLVGAGFALHWLRKRSKAPLEADWSQKPRYDMKTLRAKYVSGQNVGLRLGEPSKVGAEHLYAIDLDIRDESFADEAYAALVEFLPEYESLPTVQSGSGGLSRHFYFLCAGKFGSKKLAHSEGFFRDSEGKKHWNWEIELFGTGKQVAIPPSIHPDSGKPYRWLRAFDLDDLDMGLGPVLSESRVSQWAPKRAEAPAEDEDDLIGEVRRAPLDDIDLDKAREHLKWLPTTPWAADYDHWFKLGMALHHQFEGSQEGYDLWVEFSKRDPDKYDRDAERSMPKKWESFGRRRGDMPFTFRKIIEESNKARNAAIYSDLEDDDDDLIGGTPAATEEDEIGGKGDSDDGSSDWREWLTRSGKTGLALPTLPNIKLIVDNDPRTRGIVGYNEHKHEVVLIKKPGRRKPKGNGLPTIQLDQKFWGIHDKVNGELWRTEFDIGIRLMLATPVDQGGWELAATDRDLLAAIRASADANHFHPIKSYLESLEWDGKARLDRLFVDYLGAPNNDYTRQVARLTLIAAVARIYEPGHKFDYAVILEGAQGKGKSTFIATLGRHWFQELQGDFHDEKKMVEGMQGSWIMEIPELSQFNRSDVEAIKAFISRQKDKVRLAFERRAAEFPRQCVFIGSSNKSDYLRDDTGGRRFWPMPCTVEGQIDNKRLAREIDQIWAEALAVYRQMRVEQPFGTLELTLMGQEANVLARELQESRRAHTIVDTWVGIIAEWLETPDFDGELPTKVRIRDIAVDCLKFSDKEWGNHTRQIKAAMDKIGGWEFKTSLKIGGRVTSGFAKRTAEKAT